jgi:hypothetical protein
MQRAYALSRSTGSMGAEDGPAPDWDDAEDGPAPDWDDAEDGLAPGSGDPELAQADSVPIASRQAARRAS